MKRIVCMLLALALCLGLMAGCGGTAPASAPVSSAPEPEAPAVEETAEPAPAPEIAEEPETPASTEETPVEEAPEPVVYELPLTEEPASFTLYTTSAPPFLSPYIGTDGSYNTADSTMYFQEQTGVKIDYIEIDMFSYTQNFNLMIASGDYPDLLSGLSSYSGGITKALDDDIIIDLTDYVENDMPAFRQAVDAADVWREIMTDEGTVLAVYSLSNEDVVNRGPQVRQDWLDAQNLETPETYEQLTEVGKALKSAYGLDYTFFISALVNPGVTFSAGFDMPGFDINTSGSSFYQENGEVKNCLVSDNMKDFLKYLHGWYQDGLVSKDFFSRLSSDVKDAFRGGECAICWDNADYITEANTDAELSTQGFVAAGLPVTRQNADQTLHFSVGMNNIVGDGISISTKCEDPDLLIKTLDWCFTKPGINLCNYGIEGVSYDLDADGSAVWSTNVTQDPELTFRSALVTYTMTGLPSIWNEERYWSEIYDEAAYAAAELWMNTPNDKDWDLPGAMFFTTDESTVYSTKITDVETYANQYILSAITGEKDIDSTWQEYVDTVWSLGLQDCLDAQQSAYDRYLTRGQ